MNPSISPIHSAVTSPSTSTHSSPSSHLAILSRSRIACSSSLSSFAQTLAKFAFSLLVKVLTKAADIQLLYKPRPEYGQHTFLRCHSSLDHITYLESIFLPRESIATSCAFLDIDHDLLSPRRHLRQEISLHLWHSL